MLTKWFQAMGEVNLGHVRIGGNLVCDGGAFGATVGRALNCASTRIDGNVFLTGDFEARGAVHFSGARIGGQFACVGSAFKATKGPALECQAAQVGADVIIFGSFEALQLVDFSRVDVTGDVRIMPNGDLETKFEAGLTLEGARIGGGLFWQSVTGARACVDLTEAKVGSLRDNWEAWDGVGDLKLDGFQYDRVDSSMSVTRRLEWLGKACDGMKRPVEDGPSFDPQPHVQLANVLRSQGNRDGAAQVLVDREVRQRRAERARIWAQNTSPQGLWAWLRCSGLRAWDVLFHWLFGYGHRPQWALAWSIGLILAAGALNGVAYREGQFAPNSDVIIASEVWRHGVVAHEAGGPLPLVAWQETEAFQDYETFSWWLYGLDLFLPLDALGQEEAWRATTGRGWLGEVAFYSRWGFQLAGIVIAAMGAAVLTGVVGRRD